MATPDAPDWLLELITNSMRLMSANYKTVADAVWGAVWPMTVEGVEDLIERIESEAIGDCESCSRVREILLERIGS